MNAIAFRTEYNYDRDAVSQETGTNNRDPSKTKQEFVRDADINNIVEMFGIGYQMPPNTVPPTDQDFSDVPDFRGAQDMIRRAHEVFNALPARVRTRFENDAAKYIDFFHDPDNYHEAVKLGLVKERIPEDNPPDPQGGQELPPKTA